MLNSSLGVPELTWLIGCAGLAYHDWWGALVVAAAAFLIKDIIGDGSRGFGS